MEISLRKMKLFLAIISEGSFSNAAKKMSITQPAASIIINQIEDLMQMQLFQKNKNCRNHNLTPQGEDVANIFFKIITAYDDLMAEVLQSQKETTKEVILVQKQLSAFFCNNFVENLFTERDFTGEILEGEFDDVIEAIKLRKADLALVDQAIQNDSIDYFHVKIEQMVFLFNPTMLTPIVGRSGQIGWQNIPKGSLFLNSGNDVHHKKLKQALDLHDLHQDHITPMDSLDIIASCVQKGIQSAIVPSHSILGNEKLKNMAVLPLAQPKVLMPIGIITPRGKLNRKRISEILNCPIENIENNFYSRNLELMNL